MSTEIAEIKRLIQERRAAENKVQEITERLRESAQDIKPEIFINFDYDTIKEIYQAIQYYLQDKKELAKIQEIMEEKKEGKISGNEKTYLLSGN